MKILSKSVIFMFLFDLTIFCLSIIFWCNYFNSTAKFETFAVSIITTVGLTVLYLKGNYEIREFNITLWNMYRLIEGIFLAHIPFFICELFFSNNIFLIKYTILNILTTGIFLYLYRLGFHFYLLNLKKTKKVLIIGANERAKIIADVIHNKKALKMELAGIIKAAEAEKAFIKAVSDAFDLKYGTNEIELLNSEIKKEEDFKIDNTKIYENNEDIHNIILESKADIVIFTKKSCLITTLPKNIKYYLMPDFYELSTGKYYIDEETLEDFAFNFRDKSKFLYEALKRVLDIICSLCILIATLPITGFIAIILRLTDGKSPFYTQDRVGKNGKTFKAYKLRTMYDNDFVPKDNKKVGYVENQSEDDRVIPWCKFVRKARFDEIPQMINILKGDMSIVGPRCEWSEVANIYQKEVKGYSYRMLVNTAWTGWAQINQGYCFASDNEAIKLEYDLYYIKHRNILWDIAILLKAIFLALGGRHA